MNLFLIAIRGLLKAAHRDGHIKPPLPFEGLGWQRVDQKARVLYTRTELTNFARLRWVKFGFHDLRHHFISYAVMSGVDFMTIARWVGHRDGGILIGKVYGHLVVLVFFISAPRARSQG